MNKKPRTATIQAAAMKLKPITRRWPERFAMRVSLYRKNEEGLYHQIETDLTDEEFAAHNAWMVEVFRRVAREES